MEGEIQVPFHDALLTAQPTSCNSVTPKKYDIFRTDYYYYYKRCFDIKKLYKEAETCRWYNFLIIPKVIIYIIKAVLEWSSSTYCIGYWIHNGEVSCLAKKFSTLSPFRNVRNGSGSHPASYSMDNRGSFSGGNQFINELKNKQSYTSISLHACKHAPRNNLPFNG